jgi:taurine transport system substrate-binding protein
MNTMNRLVQSLMIGTAVTFGLLTQAVAQTRVVIGHFGDPLPYKALIADGSLDKATGWKIEWRQFASGAEVNAAMASGGIQISEIGSSPLSAGLSSGLPYQMVSAGKVIDSSEALVTRNGSGIEKPADLKGKRIAVPIGSTAHYSLMGALKMNGMTERDITLLGMSPAEIAAAWAQNAIDAAFVWVPVQAKLRENGKVMYTAGEVARAAGFHTFNAWVANTKFAAENRDGLVKFLRAMFEINADYHNNKAAWNADSPKVRAVAASVGVSPAAVVPMLEGTTYPDAELTMSANWMGGGAAKTIKGTAEFLKSAGRINKTADDYGQFVNAEFAKAAAGK